MLRTTALALLLQALSPFGAAAAANPPSPHEDGADLILRHGRFYPVATPGAVEGSLAVRDGRIVFLGDDAVAMRLAGRATKLVELGGRAVTPGLVDAHAHLLGIGQALRRVDLRGAASEEEMVRRTVAGAAALPAGAWVRGRGWDQNLWPGKAFPTHERLSAALPDRPVWLERVDGHAALLNRRAMEILGIGAASVDPPGGRFERFPDGTPTGVLVDTAAELAEAKIPPPTVAEDAQDISRGAGHCLALGLTAVTDMGVSGRTLAAYESLRQRGALPIRAAVFLDGTDEPLLAERLPRGPEIDPEARLTVRGIKLYADGALGSRGAALVEPYADDAPNLGLLRIPSDVVESMARRAIAAGFQVGVHAIGDRGNLVVLDGFERAFDGRPRPELRFRVEHAQVMRLDDIARLGRLGVVASMQPTHATSDMPWAEARVGARRVAGAYAWRKVLAAGGRLALGSDAPVESADPRLGLYAAITRQDLDGNPPGGWYPEERLTREEALRGFTLDAAWSLFLDREIGSLEVGKRADLVVFGADPMTVPEREIATVPVDLTILDGAIVHQREKQ